MARYTVTKRGAVIEFDSPLSSVAAIEVCRTLANDFAADLVRKWDDNGLSDKQIAWAHKLAMEAGEPTAPPPVDLAAGNLSGVVAMFDLAAGHLKYPRVTFDIVSPTMGASRVCLARCGARSKTPGAVNVTDGGEYGVGQWFGRINRDGSFTVGNLAGDPGKLAKWALAEMAKDVAAFAGRYGRKTCRCAFCNAALTDERSTSVGYGPICAAHYGLPYGNATPETTPGATEPIRQGQEPVAAPSPLSVDATPYAPAAFVTPRRRSQSAAKRRQLAAKDHRGEESLRSPVAMATYERLAGATL